jgi:predicted small integral membrane protein
MSPIARIAVLAETVALFGPAALVLLLAPIGVLAAFGSSASLSALLVTVCLAGGVGLYMVLNLAAHVVDNAHSLPQRRYVLAGITCGVVALLATAWLQPKTPWFLAMVAGPIVGSVHLLWLNRRTLWPAA